MVEVQAYRRGTIESLLSQAHATNVERGMDKS